MKSATLKSCFAAAVLTLTAGAVTAQRNTDEANYLDLRWKTVATEMAEEWYGTAEAIATAENVLLYQRWTGGWDKNLQMHLPLSRPDSSSLIEYKRNIHDSTFDNDATTTEIRFLAKVYNKTGIDRYKEAVEDGLMFIYQAQYPNGGWPQVYPLRPGYYSHITINDDAIVNNLDLLKEIAEGDAEFAFLDNFFVERSRKVMERGIDCLLKMQVVLDGKPTIWAAQHDEYNLMPAMGRSFELPGLSGSESVEVVRFLMEIENPSAEVIHAVECAIDWYKNHKIMGIRIDNTTTPEGNRDRIVVEDPSAKPLWGRFIDLETQTPFFADRDGVKVWSMAQIHPERRSGYGWYTAAPQKLLDAYPAWKARVGK